MSRSVGSSLSAASIVDIPNIPGLRKSASELNPKLYKEFKASRSQLGSALDEDMAIQDDFSMTDSYQEASQRLAEFSKSMTMFPPQGGAFNDISGRYSLRSQQMDRLSKSRSLPYCSVDSAPSFVSNNSRVCRFTAYFDETTPENLLETVRSRKVEIIYYTEDSSIAINEPPLHNSGIMSGKVLKRHRVMKTARKSKLPPMSESLEGVVPEIPYFTLQDFYAGAEVNIYNRSYIVIDCDPGTREYFQAILGQPFGSPIPMPETFYQPRSRAGTSKSSTAGGSSLKPKGAKSHTTLAFFEYDKKTLRFFALWDNRDELFGDKVMVRIHYGLADQLFEVVPSHERNSGRDRIPKFLKKTKIMKSTDDDWMTNTSFTNDADALSTSSTLTGSTMAGNNFPGPPKEAFRPYHWKDITIGTRLNIAAMSVVIVDADEFTREFYKSKNRPLDQALKVIPEVHPAIEKVTAAARVALNEADIWTLPPKGEFLPTHPPKDGAKLKSLQGLVLRYLANLNDPKPADITRKFIIQVHLEDDTIQIREPPQRNSGHNGGIFLARGKVDNLETNKYMQPQDIHIGACVSILSHKFNVLDADEYTIKYMENTCKLWAYSDTAVVAQKLKAKEETIRRVILTTQNLAAQMYKYEEVGNLLATAGCALVKQEVITVCRELDPKRTGLVKLTQLLKFVIDLGSRK